MAINVPVLIVENTQEHLIAIRDKIKQAKLELAKHPSYGNAKTIQQLVRELNTAAANYRLKHMRLAYSFEASLVDRVSNDNR